jgi:apolipoprotein N-acyltransferase
MRNILPSGLWKQLDRIVNMGNLDRGERFNVMSFGDGIHMGVNICFEDVFPDVSREFVRNGANLLVTLTNDSWYQQTCGGAQHTAHSVFRAVENGLPLLRSGTACESCLVLPSGEITQLIHGADGRRIGRGAATIEVPVCRDFTPTFYYRHPYFFSGLIIIGAALVFFMTGLHFFKRKSRLREIISGTN